MANKHMSIKRLFRRGFEEIKSTIRIAKKTSFKEAINTFVAKIDIQIMNRNGYKESEKVKKRLLAKHDTMIKYLEKEYATFLSKYDFNNVKLEKENKDLKDKIWLCWWQGIENAPEIVKSCVKSIEKNSAGHEVIIITDKNYKEYVSFPEWLEEKRKNGIISRTHYSDLLRLEILAKYGGIWLDSTFYCNSDIDDYFNYPLWSIKRPDYLHCSVAGGYFANYSLGGNIDNRKVYAIIRDFLLYYWKTNDEIIDYLLTDYIIVLLQKYDNGIAKAFEQIQENNPCCDELFKVLDKPYDKQLWSKLSKNTKLFKLTWKQNFPKEVKGIKTFYGKLIDNEL